MVVALYWMRADLRWHLCEPASPSLDLARLVKVVNADSYLAFFG
jgi:hypothetical protein